MKAKKTKEYKHLAELPDILTVEEVSHLLHCSACYIRNEIKAGRVPARKIAKRYLIQKQYVLELIDTKEESQNEQ